MPTWESALALRHAPVLLQKINSRYKRADFVTRVNFACRWSDIHKNWDAVWAKKNGTYRYKLTGHGYYSVVETHTHYFLMYAYYHPQDWAAFWGNPAKSGPGRIDQHLHDMEGCLAVVPKRDDPATERVEALITISHFHFYSFAGWEQGGEKVGGDFIIKGWTEDLDGPIQVTSRFSRGRGEPDSRFKLYSESGGHAIKGSLKGFGRDNRIVRYRPSLRTAEEPREDGFEKDGDAYYQTACYRLVSVFDRGGLWEHRHDPRVFQANDRGQAAFVKQDEDGSLVAGSANPPWGWDDNNDRHKPGDFAWDPARLVAGYFTGLGEYSRQYVHNRYVGIVRA
jgi:hypothetical protein